MRGFSLVELSIVLVILGLLTGGILAGQNLIRAAELRAVSTQLKNYQSAVHTFRDKYFALPGDMKTATKFWGIAAGSTGDDATCAAAVSATKATCNGDGNGIVTGGTPSHEAYRFWQHLANAGLIEGSYNGVSSNGANSYGSSFDNSPRGKLNNAVWFVWAWQTHAGNGGLVADDYYNLFELGGIVTGLEPVAGIATSEEIWNIDTKLDDGKPATGSVRPRNRTDCSNSTGVADYDAEYKLNDSATKCAIIFNEAF